MPPLPVMVAPPAPETRVLSAVSPISVSPKPDPITSCISEIVLLPAPEIVPVPKSTVTPTSESARDKILNPPPPSIAFVPRPISIKSSPVPPVIVSAPPPPNTTSPSLPSVTVFVPTPR